MSVGGFDSWPKCYRCNSIVERIEIVDYGKSKGTLLVDWHGQSMGTSDRFIEVRVRCHGEHDGCRIQYEPWWNPDPLKWDKNDQREFHKKLERTPFFHHEMQVGVVHRPEIERAATGLMKLPEDIQ